MVSREMQEYKESVARCLAQCEVMLEQEQEKRRALLGGDEKRLEQMLQTQQACYMQLESLEGKRLAAQQAAGFGGLTAKEILAQMQQGPFRQEMEKLFHQLSIVAEDLKEQNKAALEIAAANLKMIEHLVPQTKAPVQTTYNRKTATGSFHPGTSFEKKI